MCATPRLAVGSAQPDADPQAVLWGLLEALRGKGLQVQGFLSRACFAGYHGMAVATGLNPRHLDSWLMSPRTCREIFLHGVEGSDFAVVEGQFDAGPARVGSATLGGSLDVLCDWLDLPRLVVVDVTQLETCRFPPRPAQTDGLLLDGVTDECHAAEMATNLEALWGVPVLGALEALPGLRQRVAGLPPGSRPPRDLCWTLGQQFLRYARLDRVIEMGTRREVIWTPPRLFGCGPLSRPIVLALAYDAAFNCCFQDTLDLLESRGAVIVDFSPLEDERLPEGTDVVCIGCGHPERYIAELSHNHCMKLALRNHVRRGGRVYAEGGGLAYLCEYLETPQGELHRMAGIFRAVARYSPSPSPPLPVELTLDAASWLGESGVRLRGYRNPAWSLTPLGAVAGYALEPQHQYDLMGVWRAIGSQLHLDFAAQPDLLPCFLQPSAPRHDHADPWTVMP